MGMKVTFKPGNIEVEVGRGASIMDAARVAGVELESECGGRSRCGKCKVVAPKGVSRLTPREREHLSPGEIKDKVRLACQAKVLARAVVFLPAAPSGREHILEEGVSRAFAFQPFIKKIHLGIAPKDLKRGKAVDETLCDFLGAKGIKNPIMDFATLKTLPSLLYQNQGGVTALMKEGEVLGFEPGDSSTRLFGLAVDIGTTTVVGYLFDLVRGTLVGVASALNKQQLHGADVISRIDFALNEPDGLKRLQGLAVETFNDIIQNLCARGGLASEEIYGLVFVGNTTMNHLFWGMSPRFLSRSPYNPLTTLALSAPPHLLGVKMSPLGRVFSLPLVSGFIGSDTVGVVLSTGIHRARTPKLAIDIGTNGEIVLYDGRSLLACSCAAGPAFEGAQIQCGMRGAGGAIDRVDFSEDAVLCRVIDDEPPMGICGSGLVDAVAGMLREGLITPDGKLLRAGEVANPYYARRLGRKKYNQFVLCRKKKGEGGKEVVITQKDIRELQLAKGAMIAGVRILLQRCDLKEDDIREVYLAGAFGNYVRAESAVAIGLLPVLKNARITPVGNAAGSGAKMVLLSKSAFREAARVAKRIHYVELAKIPTFHQEFMEGMVFPS